MSKLAKILEGALEDDVYRTRWGDVKRQHASHEGINPILWQVLSNLESVREHFLFTAAFGVDLQIVPYKQGVTSRLLRKVGSQRARDSEKQISISCGNGIETTSHYTIDSAGFSVTSADELKSELLDISVLEESTLITDKKTIQNRLDNERFRKSPDSGRMITTRRMVPVARALEIEQNYHAPEVGLRMGDYVLARVHQDSYVFIKDSVVSETAENIKYSHTTIKHEMPFFWINCDDESSPLVTEPTRELESMLGEGIVGINNRNRDYIIYYNDHTVVEFRDDTVMFYKKKKLSGELEITNLQRDPAYRLKK